MNNTAVLVVVVCGGERDCACVSMHKCVCVHAMARELLYGSLTHSLSHSGGLCLSAASA